MCTAWPIEFQGDVNDELTVLLTVQKMRQLRVAHFQADNTHNPSQQVQQSDALHEERDCIHAAPALVPTEQEECIVPENGKSSEQALLLTVHR